MHIVYINPVFAEKSALKMTRNNPFLHFVYLINNRPRAIRWFTLVLELTPGVSCPSYKWLFYMQVFMLPKCLI